MKGSRISTTQAVLSPSAMFLSGYILIQKAQGCASFELFPWGAPIPYLSTPFPCLPQDLPRNYKHRCARFHFALLPLCPPLLYFSYSKWRGPQGSSPAFLSLKQGQSRTGPCVGVRSSSVVTHPSFPNLKTYLRFLKLFSRTKLLWESWWFTLIWLFITVSHIIRIFYSSLLYFLMKCCNVEV